MPDPKPYHHGFIGATAYVYDMTRVTKTLSFADMGADLFNPWSVKRGLLGDILRSNLVLRRAMISRLAAALARRSESDALDQ